MDVRSDTVDLISYIKGCDVLKRGCDVIERRSHVMNAVIVMAYCCCHVIYNDMMS